MVNIRKVIVVEGVENAKFLLRIGKSEVLIIETPSLWENDSYKKEVFGKYDEISEDFYELV